MNNGKLVPSHCVTDVTMFINITEVGMHFLWRSTTKKEKEKESGLERSRFGYKMNLCHLIYSNHNFIGKDISRENTIQNIHSKCIEWW